MKGKATNKYTFSLSEKKKNIGFRGGEIDFENMNKGYYDDIESKDNIIKELKKSLDTTKTWTIKNCVYANIDIPQTWKNKLTYTQELMKIISDDKVFFNYLSKAGGSKEPENQKKMSTAQISNINNEINQGALNQSQIFNSSRDFGDDNHSKSKSHFHLNNLEESKDNIEVISSPKTKGFSHLMKKKTINQARNWRVFTDKEKREILDNYRESFIFNKKIETSVNENYPNSNLPPITKSTLTQSTVVVPEDSHNVDKSKMFKSSIYSLLLPNKGSIKPFESNSEVEQIMPKKKVGLDSVGPYLNFNYEEYNKKIEIKNPTVKKILEDINYYGPYFSHCPSCRNKNLEFYQTLEPHSCLNILNFLKKTRNKSKYVVKNSK